MADAGARAKALFGSDGEAGRLIAALDWSATTLGPVETWSSTLRNTIALILQSPVPIVTLWDEDGWMIYNDAYSGFAGDRHPRLLGSKVREGWPEVADFNDNIMKVGLAGGTLTYDDIELVLDRTGTFESGWMNLGYSPITDETGRPVGVMAIVIETTEKVRAVQELRRVQDELSERTRALQILNEAGTTIAADQDLESLVQTVTDAGVVMTGAQFGAFFYNVLNDAGESYMLYSISGVPREAFSKFPMPRNTEVFSPTFSGEGIVRSDDITRDPRYGKNTPRKGMPEGHLPVRSYLAVPVRSRTGEVLGGLFFGHPEVGVFTEQAEHGLSGLAAQAAVAIDNARLFQAAQREIADRVRAEAELQALNATLEERVAEEVRQRMEVETVLRQAQKMETVGQLTGGVAHDFNNLLTVIMGGLATVRRAETLDDPRVQKGLDMAAQGAQRAAVLTSRLLAFSRRQPLAPEPVDLNHIVRDMTELLHRTLGEQVELEGVLAPRLWTVEADRNQLESAILNLAINARDAMPDGGRLTIETGNVMLDDSYVALDAEVSPGQYAMIAVSDDGSGMDKAALERAFEPFFTTKEVGRGTGLGLSMVYGFVKQSGGHVTLYSEVGQGTTVKIYLPRHHGSGVAARPVAPVVAPPGGKDEVILVVEDHDDVREFSVGILTDLGYSVLQARDAEEALEHVRAADRIDLLFTDVVLPGRTGRQLADEAVALRPGLPVLFTTGYSRNAIVHQGRLDADVQLLSKPFTFEQLATRVRDLLDAAG